MIVKGGKAVSSHTDLDDMPDIGGTITDHDSRYYTEAEIDVHTSANQANSHGGDQTLTKASNVEFESLDVTGRDFSVTTASDGGSPVRFLNISALDRTMTMDAVGAWTWTAPAGMVIVASGANQFVTTTHKPYNTSSDLGGTTTKRWQDLWLHRNLTDGTNSLTVANAKTAYDHSLIVTGNPHVIDITDLTTYAHGGLSDMPDSGGTNEDHDKRYALRIFYNGTIKEEFDALVTSDGATVTMTLTNAVSGDLTLQYSDGDTTFDVSEDGTIALTAGSDVSPTENFIYILQSAKSTLVKSISDWPETEHTKIGYYLVPSAGFVQSNGTYINQNWNDDLTGTDLMGDMAHVGEKLRRLSASYFSGIDGNGTQGYLTPTASNVEFKSTGGIIYQKHKHTFSAVDTSAGDVVLVKNWFEDAFHSITNLFDITADSIGTTIGNNKYFNLVFWGAGNKTSEYSPAMCNLPNGFYNTQSAAEEDVSGHDDFSMPREFTRESSTGFLIARVTIRMGTTWTVISTTDLRGQTPATASGGVGSIVQEFADNAFKIFDETDITKELAFDVGTNVSPATTRTLQVPNASGILALTSQTDGTINHDTDLAGVVANEHIDWTNASDNLLTTGDVSVGDDLFFPNNNSVIEFGGGDVTITYTSATLTFGGAGGVTINFNNQPMTNVNIDSGTGHDQFSDFVANEHIDWTAASDDFDTSEGGSFGDTVSVTLSDAASTSGLEVEHTQTVASGGAVAALAFSMITTHTSGTIVQPVGAFGGAKINSDGDATVAYGVLGDVSILDTKTPAVFLTAGICGSVGVNDGAVTYAAGLWGGAPTVDTGSIFTAMGVYGAGPSGAVNNFAGVFEGDVLIASDKKLFLEGSINGAGDTYLIYDSSGTTLDLFVNGAEILNMSSTQAEFLKIVKLSGIAGDVFAVSTDNTDPTSGGGAATGRIAIDVGGVTKYIPYY